MLSSGVPKKIPDTISGRARQWLAEGHGATEVVRKVAQEFDGFKVSVTWVAALAVDEGVELKRGGPAGIKLAPRSPHRERARYFKSKGLTLSAIAAELGISRQAVSKLLRTDES